jgi:SHS family lactate transporter-like MFS transporter
MEGMTTVATTGQPLPWWREPTRQQWAAFSAAWVGWILDAFDFTIFLMLMPRIEAEFGVKSVATTASIALTLLVRLVGGVGAGWMADRWGRKLPLMLSIVWFALCDGAVAFAPSFAWVLVLRTLFGLGMGAEWTSGSTLVMETWPERSRGIVSGILQGSWAIGYLLAAVVTALVDDWRTVFLLAALPALLAFPIRFWVPESPDWKEAAERKRRQRPSSLRELLDMGLATKLLWASGMLAFSFGAYYGLVGVYSKLLAGLGLGQQRASWMTILFNVGMLLGATGCGVLASRKGVRLALVLPSLLVLPFLPLYVGMVPSLLWLGAFAGGLFGTASSGVTPLLLTSLFPASVRARCVGLVYHTAAFAAAFVPLLIASLVEYAGMTFAQGILLVACVGELGLVAVVLLRPRGVAVEGARAPAPH